MNLHLTNVFIWVPDKPLTISDISKQFWDFFYINKLELSSYPNRITLLTTNETIAQIKSLYKEKLREAFIVGPKELNILRYENLDLVIDIFSIQELSQITSN